VLLADSRPDVMVDDSYVVVVGRQPPWSPMLAV